MNVAEGFIKILHKYGVREVFGIPGDAINHVMDALRRSDGMEYIHVVHEEAGAFAASAQVKHGAPLAACMGTSGPGAVHLLNGLYDAKKDGCAVIAITGQVESKKEGLEFHQEINLDGLFADVACFSHTIHSAESALQVFDLACRTAMEERSVVRISIPLDIAKQKAEGIEIIDRPPLKPAVLHADDECLAAAKDLIESKERPLILAGIGVLDNRNLLENFSRKIAAPVIKTLRAKALLADEHPQSLGGLGLLGTRPAVEAMRACDLLILVGTNFPYTEFLTDKAKVIQFDNCAANIGRRIPVDVPVYGDCGESLRRLLAMGVTRGDDKFLSRCQKEMKTWWRLMDRVEDHDTKTLRPQTLARKIGEIADDNAIFCCDTGSVTSFVAKSLRLRAGQDFSLSGNLASMGYALPAAIGAKLRHKNRQVICIAGDGSIDMGLGEFQTLKRLGLPIKVVILNNSRLHLIDFEENVEGLPRYGTDLINPDFVKVAESFGMKAITISTPQDLDGALREAFAYNGPFIIDAKVNQKQMLFPPEIKLEQAFGFAEAKLKEWWLAISGSGSETEAQVPG